MKNKINIRLAGIALVAIIATVASVTIIYYSLFKGQVRSDLAVSAKLLKDTHYFESIDADTEEIDLSTDIRELRVTWIGSDGTVLYDNDARAGSLANHMDRPEVRAALASGSGESVRESDTMKENTFYYALLLDNGTVLRVATDARSIWSVFLSAAPVIAAIVLLIISICLLLSHLLTRQLISPIETMARNLEAADYSSPYKELEPFTEMIRSQHADILSAAKARQDFTASVSHELKTPLTAISGYAELIENDMVDKTETVRFAGQIHANAERLVNMINEIIKLSELDHKEIGRRFENADLYEIASAVCEEMQVNADRQSIEISCRGESITRCVDINLIDELLCNLVQNAITYNNAGGHVYVSVSEIEGRAQLRVKDDGIGIPEDALSHIFERFYRVDKSRSRERGGTGLGLAIVKHIAEIHDAEITIDSRLGRGTDIRVLI